MASLTVREWGDPALPGVLFWPGLGAVGAYFASLAQELPYRAVAVDPPGFGDSEPLVPCNFERLIEQANAVAQECGCRAFVGHSLGAHVGVGLACAPPAELQTAVLLDGGFMEADEMATFGMPLTEGRARLIEWLADNTMRFPSWDSAVDALAEMIGIEKSEALEAYAREALVEIEGEIRDPQTPEHAADLLLATFEQDARPLAEGLAIPTLLVASGRPEELRPTRQQAWNDFVSRSALLELRVVDEWGHNAIFQQPERLASLIRAWLERYLDRSLN